MGSGHCDNIWKSIFGESHPRRAQRVNNIKILKYDSDKIQKKKEDKSSSFTESKNLKNLEFRNTSPVCYYKDYIDSLFQNVEELDSYKNLKRVEWEIRQKGNIVIKIPKIFYLNENSSKTINNKVKLDNDINDNNNILFNKIKIIINYVLIEKNIGIIFQEFNKNQKDNYNIICYTPNFYYNTQYWLPCIYNLNLQIKWSLYLYIPEEYISYSSCLLNQIIKNNNGKTLIIYKNIENTISRNVGFIVVNKKYYDAYINMNYFIVYQKDKKENIEKYLIYNKLIETIYNYYNAFFDNNLKDNNLSTVIIFIPYLLFNNPFQGFSKFVKLKEDNYLNFVKFPYLYILPEKYIYNENIPEISKFQLKVISKLFITNYIGGLIIEKTYADFWIINSLENWLSNLFLNKLYNNNYTKIKIYKWLLKIKKICKKGEDILPFYTNEFSNPAELQLNPVLNLKSKIIFSLIEAQVGINNIKSIINKMINERETNISTQILLIIWERSYIPSLNYLYLEQEWQK